ncbi:response regulator transcription factor [Streptomyces griseorubiginosus]|uniref:response regulator transcription factor n=1 Tax=Streptomyces griseorubiginosus TaxID=67304 RepID=UPI0027E366A7|nr:response regulator transcription factor [Streptomyces griseorubiginosus]
MRILLVERDQRLARCVAADLRRQGYEVDQAARGGEALRSCRQADMVLLDLSLPDLPGPHVCRDIRAIADVPVLALSGDRTEATRVRALRAGADDCLDKPFGFRELVARIEAIMRRAGAARPPETAPVPDLPVTTDAAARVARVGERELSLTEKEFDLLHLLVSRPGTVVSREEIMAKVWGAPWNSRSRTVDTHVGSLRKKLGHDEWIATVRGVGFRFAPTGHPAPAGPIEVPVRAGGSGRRAARPQKTAPLSVVLAS